MQAKGGRPQCQGVIRYSVYRWQHYAEDVVASEKWYNMLHAVCCGQIIARYSPLPGRGCGLGLG